MLSYTSRVENYDVQMFWVLKGLIFPLDIYVFNFDELYFNLRDHVFVVSPYSIRIRTYIYRYLS